MGALADLYEGPMNGARERFARRRGPETVLDPGVDPALLECFLIHYCALGVQMTEPVESWISRAGERCRSVGLADLGEALVLHAKHEAGHHEMMIADTRRLVPRWNARRRTPLDAKDLLALEPTPGVARYRRLHEAVIAGPAPYAQLAIEFEIEALSVRFGPRLIGQCARILGAAVLEGLSFLQEHVAVDVGHTEFNRVQLERLLTSQPTFGPALVAAGAEALEAYGDFLDDCLTAASRKAAA